MLNKIASKWRQRGFNIESLTVGHCEVPGLSRMTFTVDGAAHDIEQVTKQLYKVIEVVKITDVTDEEHRRARAGADQGRDDEGEPQRDHRDRQLFRAKIVDVAADSLVVEVTGTEDKIDAIFQLLPPYGIKELVRTGRVAMSRGSAGSVTVNGAGGPSAGSHNATGRRAKASRR